MPIAKSAIGPYADVHYEVSLHASCRAPYECATRLSCCMPQAQGIDWYKTLASCKGVTPGCPMLAPIQKDRYHMWADIPQIASAQSLCCHGSQVLRVIGSVCMRFWEAHFYHGSLSPFSIIVNTTNAHSDVCRIVDMGTGHSITRGAAQKGKASASLWTKVKPFQGGTRHAVVGAAIRHKRK